MKKNKVLILLAGALALLVSCNSNEDIAIVSTPPAQEENFLGKTAIAFAKSINETNATRATTTYSVKSINALPVRQDLPVTRSAAELPDFYTVALNNNQGTVLLSAKNNQAKPLAYFMKENDINVDEILKDTISDLSFLIQSTIEQNMDMPIPTRGSENEEYTIVKRLEPKCKVWWHQESPYNKFCPKHPLSSTPEEPCVAGCVAVAGALATTVLRPNISFINSWDKLIQPYPSDETIDKIAFLISYIGAEIKTDYRPKKSGASVHKLSRFFSKFGIKDYDAEHAIDVLDTAHGVIVVSGKRSKHGWFITSHYANGHAFLADGYVKYNKQDDPYYLHLNYGWGQKYNKDVYVLSAEKNWKKEEAKETYDGKVYIHKILYFTFGYDKEKFW